MDFCVFVLELPKFELKMGAVFFTDGGLYRIGRELVWWFYSMEAFYTSTHSRIYIYIYTPVGEQLGELPNYLVVRPQVPAPRLCPGS